MSTYDVAACLFDPELHDGPGRAESPAERTAREAVAIEVCHECPLLAACKRWTAVVRPMPGVWAGTVRRTARPGEVAA